MENDRQNCGDK